MDGMSPYYGGRFAPRNPLNPWLPTAFDRSRKSDDQRHPELMFRSSIRDPGRPSRHGTRRVRRTVTPLRFDPAAQLLLRSALAAVNTEDLRDADDDVTSHLIELRVRGGLARRVEEKVPVPGVRTQRQPYITEVYVNTDDRPTGEAGLLNPKGYVAIELFNPYPVDINVGWMERRAHRAPGHSTRGRKSRPSLPRRRS